MRHMYLLLLVQDPLSNVTSQSRCVDRSVIQIFQRLYVKSERIFQSNEIPKFLYDSPLLRGKFGVN